MDIKIFNQSNHICFRRPLLHFTLVEMLVVTCIIAIFGSLLLPIINNALSVAKDTSCATQQRQLGIGVSSYADDYRGFLPTNWSYADRLYGSYGSSDPIRPAGYYGLGKLFNQSYITDWQLFACGSEDEPKKGFASEGNGGAYQFSINQRNGDGNNATDLWFRCGRRARNGSSITSITFRINKIENDGLVMCAAKNQYSRYINWYELHQRRGFNLLFVDQHIEFFSYSSHPPPSTWGGSNYRDDNPGATFGKAIQLLRE